MRLWIAKNTLPPPFGRGPDLFFSCETLLVVELANGLEAFHEDLVLVGIIEDPRPLQTSPESLCDLDPIGDGIVSRDLDPSVRTFLHQERVQTVDRLTARAVVVGRNFESAEVELHRFRDRRRRGRSRLLWSAPCHNAAFALPTGRNRGIDARA